MQNIDLICVGKLNAKYFAEGVAEYQKRLAAFASFRIVPGAFLVMGRLPFVQPLRHA